MPFRKGGEKAKAFTGDRTFCEAAGGRFFLIEPQRGVRREPRAGPAAGAAGPALGQRSQNLFPLRLHVFCVGGEGQGEGEDLAHSRKPRFVPRSV